MRLDKLLSNKDDMKSGFGVAMIQCDGTCEMDGLDFANKRTLQQYIDSCWYEDVLRVKIVNAPQ